MAFSLIFAPVQQRKGRYDSWYYQTYTAEKWKSASVEIRGYMLPDFEKQVDLPARPMGMSSLIWANRISRSRRWIKEMPSTMPLPTNGTDGPSLALNLTMPVRLKKACLSADLSSD
ncbi:MAG: hypothetical protein LKM30_01940 [Bacilli bacterium]|nr:hypothetical protein [Bacilli bacterium]